MPNESHQFYKGRAPGDLKDVPNQHVETWLTDPLLIFIFMEVIPDIAAGIIFLMFLTVMAIGFSLLIQHIKLKYAEKRRLKQNKQKVLRRRVRRKILPKPESNDEDEQQLGNDSDATDYSPSLLRASRLPGDKLKNDEQRKREIMVLDSRSSINVIPRASKDAILSEMEDKDMHLKVKKSLSSGSTSSAEVGILTGTKRKPKSKSKKHRHKKVSQGGENATGADDEDKKPRRRRHTHLSKFIQRYRRNTNHSNQNQQ